MEITQQGQLTQAQLQDIIPNLLMRLSELFCSMPEFVQEQTHLARIQAPRTWITFRKGHLTFSVLDGMGLVKDFPYSDDRYTNIVITWNANTMLNQLSWATMKSLDQLDVIRMRNYNCRDFTGVLQLSNKDTTSPTHPYTLFCKVKYDSRNWWECLNTVSSVEKIQELLHEWSALES